MRFFRFKAIIILLVFCTIWPAAADTKHSEIGVTFSQVQCEYLALDWRQTYEDTLSMGFDVIRLGSYWNRVEKSEGLYDFTELDWQIERAQKNKIRILLTVGMKAPRWPEFFIPSWLLDKIDLRWGSDAASNKLLRKKVLAFIRQVVSRYKDKECISSWQIENEPLNRSGPHELWIGESFLKEEIALIKSLDPKRPVVVNAMTYPNKFLRFFARLLYRRNPAFAIIDMADIPAINVYPIIGQKLLTRKICFLSNREDRNDYIKSFIAKAGGRSKKIWITELQAEPWEPGELVHLGKEPPITCSAGQLLSLYTDMNSLGVDTVILWGVEYWYFRKKLHGDNTWVESALQLLFSHDKR